MKVVPDTLSVIDEGLSGILDPGLWDIVQKEHRLLITGDKAFANIDGVVKSRDLEICL